MIVLDTDHISILQHDESVAADRLWQRLSESSELIVTSAVTVEEQTRSWLALINRYSDVDQQVTYYDRFIASLTFFAKWRLLPFDAHAAGQFKRLRTQRVRIATIDLKIASIVLVHAAALLSANLRDFDQVPGLRVENWLGP